MPLTMSKAGDTVTIQKITGKDAVVDKVHRGQHMAEVDLLAGGQGDGVQGLQR